MLTFCATPATTTGRLCRWRVWPGRPCPHHHTEEGIPWSELLARERAVPRPLRPGTGRGALREREKPATQASPPRDVPECLARRDLAGMGWWLIEQCVAGELDSRYAAVIVSSMRLLAALPDAGLSDDEAWNEAYLRGNIANGVPPETEEEWALARAIYNDEALAYLRTWNTLLPSELVERDNRDVDEPLRLVEHAGVELEPSLVIDEED